MTEHVPHSGHSPVPNAEASFIASAGQASGAASAARLASDLAARGTAGYVARRAAADHLALSERYLSTVNLAASQAVAAHMEQVVAPLSRSVQSAQAGLAQTVLDSIGKRWQGEMSRLPFTGMSTRALADAQAMSGLAIRDAPRWAGPAGEYSSTAALARSVGGLIARDVEGPAEALRGLTQMGAWGKAGDVATWWKSAGLVGGDAAKTWQDSVLGSSAALSRAMPAYMTGALPTALAGEHVTHALRALADTGRAAGALGAFNAFVTGDSAVKDMLRTFEAPGVSRQGRPGGVVAAVVELAGELATTVADAPGFVPVPRLPATGSGSAALPDETSLHAWMARIERRLDELIAKPAASPEEKTLREFLRTGPGKAWLIGLVIATVIGGYAGVLSTTTFLRPSAPVIVQAPPVNITVRPCRTEDEQGEDRYLVDRPRVQGVGVPGQRPPHGE